MRSIFIFTLLLFTIHTNAQTSLAGKVTEASGDPILYGDVFLFEQDKQIDYIKTDFDGNYNFANMEPCTCDLLVFYPGFRPVKITGIIVKPGQITPLNVVLEYRE